MKWSESISHSGIQTLCNPMDCSLPGSSICGILQVRILELLAIPFAGGSSWPRDWTQVSHTAGGFFTIWATRKDQHTMQQLLCGNQHDSPARLEDYQGPSICLIHICLPAPRSRLRRALGLQWVLTAGGPSLFGRLRGAGTRLTLLPQTTSLGSQSSQERDTHRELSGNLQDIPLHISAECW